MANAEKPPDERTTDKPARPATNVGWPIAFALVAISAIAAGTFIFHECSPARLSRNLATGLAQAFQPQVNVNSIVYTTLSNMVNQSKLVVLSTHINVDMTKTNEKIVWGIPLGTTTVYLRALDNGVQYFVPLATISRSDFKYDGVHKRLTVRVPSPRLDAELVEVQSDPAKIEFRTDVGWARLNSRSGQFLRDQAQRELRPALLHEGNNPLYLEKARSNARESLKKLLEPMAEHLREDVELEVEFK